MSATPATFVGPCEVCGRTHSVECTDFLRVRTVNGDQTQCAWCCQSQRPSVFAFLFGDAAPEVVAVAAEHCERAEAERREEGYRAMERDIARARYRAREAALSAPAKALPPRPATSPTLLGRLRQAVFSR